MRRGLLVVVLFVVAVSVYGQADFFSLVRDGTPEEVKAAIEAGVNVHQRLSDSSMTPLMFAAKYSRYPAVLRLLLHAGAKLETRDETDAATALMIAAGWNPDPAIAAELLHAGAKLEERDSYNSKTPLMFAAMYNTNPEVVLMLLDAGASGTLKSFKGLTAFDDADRNPALKGGPAWTALKSLQAAVP